MTGRELVTASLRLIGAIAPGESLESQEATEGLSTLNSMLGSWSNESLLIYTITRETPLTLTAGDGTYTMGTSGSFTTRPMKLVSAFLRDETQSPAVEYPINILNLDQWTSILLKDTQSTYPTDLYDDGGYPLRTLNLYPVPSAAHKLVLYTERPLTEIATLDTSISLPQGYERALKYNLAIELAPEYGRQVSDLLMTSAMESKASIKRANHKPSYLRVDAALIGNGNSFNILTGDHR